MRWRWCGRAFGLALDSEFPLPGLSPGEPPAGRLIELYPMSADGIVSDWLEAGSERIAYTLDASGRTATWIEAHPAKGFLFEAPKVGRFRLGADGRRLACTPPGAEAELWRLYLAAQVLPFASVVQGLEVLHASAVAVDGTAFALVGASGAGKSTLALNMHLAGAEFLTDDVLAIEIGENGLVAHAGLAWTKLREAARELVDPRALESLGPPVSADALEARFELQRGGDAFALGGLVLLEPADVDQVSLRPEVPDARELLSSTFNFVLEGPDRLRNQLEVCAALSSGPVVRALVPHRPGPEAARALLAYLRASSGQYDFRMHGEAGARTAC